MEYIPVRVSDIIRQVNRDIFLPAIQREFVWGIQTAMGWTNSHLHRFEIFDKRYTDPVLLDDDFDGFKCIDSTKTKMSAITPNAGKRFSVTYVYDFGDGWEHEILFKGCPKKERGKKYPQCLEGARACRCEDSLKGITLGEA